MDLRIMIQKYLKEEKMFVQNWKTFSSKELTDDS